MRVPVGPVEPVGEHRQRERVRQLQRPGQHLDARPAVHVAAVDVAVLAVGPVESTGDVVDRQTVRPEHARRHDDSPGGRVAVHAGSLDLRHLAPVRPEHQPVHTRAVSPTVTYHVTYHVRPHQPIIDQQGLGLRGLVHKEAHPYVIPDLH